MYLANDVIQNSKRKGPEYGKEFGKVMLKAFHHIGDTCHSDEKTIGSLGRIINIWNERGVYDTKMCNDFRNALNKESGNDEADNVPVVVAEKRKPTADESKSKEPSAKKHKPTASNQKERVKSETIEVNGTVETHVILSVTPLQGNNTLRYIFWFFIILINFIILGDPPEPEELIKALQDLENSASSDAVVRERIANFPPEVSEVSLLSKLGDKEQAAKLAAQVIFGDFL